VYAHVLFCAIRLLIVIFHSSTTESISIDDRRLSLMDINNHLINSNTIASSTAPKRIRIESDDWIDKESCSRLLERWKEQDLYIDHLELCVSQLQQAIESNERLREKEAECKKLKSMLNYRFLTKTTPQQSLVTIIDTFLFIVIEHFRFSSVSFLIDTDKRIKYVT
jgi:hypothetical protein